ncbi:dynamin family protein [Catellatospora sichuanensis]|uniref:dynamin family protein n=1 Tax=Catellatospora sichuanensis TaxID=1969805 RepID=UPI001182F2EB|nr:dynamin family protein [Catellatospora sichuanensis]
MSRSTRTLDDAVRQLMQEAWNLSREDGRAAAQLDHLYGRLQEPVHLAVVGPARSGKSTVVNGLIGDQIAPLPLGDGHDVVTRYADGPQPRVTARTADGAARELATTRSAHGLRMDPRTTRRSAITELRVTWPARSLRHINLVDTPGTDADDGHHAPVEHVTGEADAILYASQEIRTTDLQTLQTAQHGAVATAAPVNTVIVLTHADEIGGGRIDALLTARQLARRHQRDPAIAAMCTGVVAYGGLVALAGRTLSDADFTAVAAIAAAPRETQDACLMSADRFAGDDGPLPVDPDVRRRLLHRLGIHGVRLATTLARTGCATRAELAAELIRRSGLAELREVINGCFVERRTILKARTALAGLERLAGRLPGQDGVHLRARVEQLLATAHDFRELRLLAAMRSGQVAFTGDAGTEAHRLLGGNGTDAAVRLGAEHELSGGELWDLTADALHRWQQHAEDPRLGLHQRRAATAVVRSCEGMLVALGDG